MTKKSMTKKKMTKKTMKKKMLNKKTMKKKMLSKKKANLIFKAQALSNARKLFGFNITSFN
jgi:hypothetical protein